MGGMSRKSHPSDISDEEWSFVAPYLTVIDEEAPQRNYPLREMFNAVRWLPNDFLPWTAVCQQWRRWNAAGSFEAMVSSEVAP